MKTMFLAIIIAASLVAVGAAVYFVLLADDDKATTLEVTDVVYYDATGYAGNTNGWELKDGVLTITMVDFLEADKDPHALNIMELNLTGFFGKDKVLGNGFYYTVDKDFGGVTKDTAYGLWVMDKDQNDINAGSWAGATEEEFPTAGKSYRGIFVQGMDDKVWAILPFDIGTVTYTFHTDGGETLTLKIVVVPVPIPAL
jgi:hypothetical protein